ncbi:L-lactate dehydrogenase [Cadophora sp. DSE1049]|nr:L-lactate dehydrogenase [Cadophora sp. DSE1049]
MAIGSKKISLLELRNHSRDGDAWTAINGTVWNISKLASAHPGGEEVIRDSYGRDATKTYNSVHGARLIARYLGEGARLGTLDGDESEDKVPDNGPESLGKNQGQFKMPALDSILNLYDFEDVAQKALTERSWAYSSGASNDSLTHAANVDWYRRIFFRPRVLKGVGEVDISTTILGQRYEIPIFNCPVSLVKLAHPDGELAVARAAVTNGTATIIPTMASFAVDEIVEVLPAGYPFFFQLYVNSDRAVTEKLLAEVVSLKPRAILVTVDLPVFGKREANERYEYKAQKQKQKQKQKLANARSASTAIDPQLQWKDIAWIKEVTGVPVFIKGVQCAADARRAYEYGCAGIYISNHGGRAVDTAPPGILTLMEIQANCPEVLSQMEVFIDGGIRRGSDILKAICLGASAICIGRPFFYALAYGQEGVERAFQILRDELAVAMQLNGITKLSEASPSLLNTAALDKYVYRSNSHPWAKKIDRSRL